MKRPRKPKPQTKSDEAARIIHFDPRFTPEGPAGEEQKSLADFWIAVKSAVIGARSKRQGTRNAAHEVPAGDLEQLRRRYEYSKLRGPIFHAMRTLGDAAMAGDEDAAKTLAEETLAACQWLSIVENKQPALFGKIARLFSQWPVLASDEPGWEKKAADRIGSLGLGADLHFMKTRLRRARGTDANLPARRWAKTAVCLVDEARFHPMTIGSLIRELGSPGAMADFCTETRWQIAPRREWAREAVRLETLSQKSLPKWKAVIRQMIREDMPDFHECPEWANQRRTAAAGGRDSVGEIQNAILDDIGSALARLAP